MHAPAVRRASAAEVPIVDFGALYSPSLAERKSMARAIHAACAGPGFFYIVNHQFPQAVIARAQAAMQRFFALPVARKMRNHYLDWPNHRGYVPSGGITADHSLEGSSDISEAIEMAHDLPADDPDHVRGIRFYGPNNWPAEPADFRWALGTYFDCQLELGRQLFRAFEYALDLEEGYFTSKYTKPLARLRVCYYEPQPEPLDIAHIGLGAHTDYECFTTVWQDREGLQMLSRDGEWLILPPVEGSFAVNLGDLMQQWTNDMFVSTMHRVINTSGSKRYSLVQFFGVDYEVEVEAIPRLHRPGQPLALRADKGGRPLRTNGRPHLPLRRIESLPLPIRLRSTRSRTAGCGRHAHCRWSSRSAPTRPSPPRGSRSGRHRSR